MLCFDIETGPLADVHKLELLIPPFDPDAVKTGNLKDPEKIAAKISEAEATYYDNAYDRAALSAITGEVLAVGWYSSGESEGGNITLFWQHEQCSERQLLRMTWAAIADAIEGGQRVVGHNIFGFDLPFLIRRSWANDVKVPEIAMPQNGRYWHRQFVDLMRLYGLGEPREFIKLDTLAQWFRIGAKTEGVDGGDFAGLFRSAKKEDRDHRAMDYLQNDVRLTHNVALAMGVR